MRQHLAAVGDREQVRERGETPTLSVVILSSGAEDVLERAILHVSDAVFELGAGVVVVRCEDAPGKDRVERMARQHGVELLMSPPGMDRHGKVDLGMVRATGDLVTIRQDVEIDGWEWLNPLARRMGIDLKAALAVERTVERPMSVVELQGRRNATSPRRTEATAEAVS